MITPYTAQYLKEVAQIAAGIDAQQVDKMVDILADTRQNEGRIFFIGVGGGAGNAGHAVNDFRKIAGIRILCPDGQCFRTDGARE